MEASRAAAGGDRAVGGGGSVGRAGGGRARRVRARLQEAAAVLVVGSSRMQPIAAASSTVRTSRPRHTSFFGSRASAPPSPRLPPALPSGAACAAPMGAAPCIHPRAP